MKKLLLLMGLVLLVGCSNGGGGGSDSPTSPSISSAPVISNLRFSPSSATVGEGGGNISVSVIFDWTDADGDISKAYILSYDSSWNVTRTHYVDASVYAGKTSGTGSITDSTVSTTSAITQNVGYYLVDSKGNTSNTLTGTFIVN